MSEIENGSNSEVVQESSAPESSQMSENTNASSSEAAPKENYVPYSRFQELVQQKNEFAEKIKEYDKRFQDYEQRFNKPAEAPKPAYERNVIMDRLKGIDPEFHKLMEDLLEKADKVNKLEPATNELAQWKEQQAAQASADAYKSTFNNLVTKNKIDPKEVSEYQALIQHRANSDPSLKVTDLERVFNDVHKQRQEFKEAYKRSVLAEYAQGKKADSSVPSTAKGSVTKPSSKAPNPYTGDKETDRATMAKRITELMRAQRE